MIQDMHAGVVFSQLAMGSPSPVLLLDTGTAAFHSCTFEAISGPQDCAVMHAYSGAILLEASTFLRAPSLYHEHQICLADSYSQVYGTAALLSDNSLPSAHAMYAVVPQGDTESEGIDITHHTHAEGEVWVVDLESGDSSKPKDVHEAQEHSPNFLTTDGVFMDLVQVCGMLWLILFALYTFICIFLQPGDRTNPLVSCTQSSV